ncbi:trypsin-like serine peptidase [Herpetosiphon giganteus]|uniref:trypsin-like serine peptidase n=1 Tax=Herpetosiphon giganteus TaxID=2029754 RepID=UPI0019584856|nr:trypsin-like serine protease [Herpetosiphon giganteus]MBM7846545.1 V8-like Glu-specific endopeptidase [Herpetosiphon giganteus]
MKKIVLLAFMILCISANTAYQPVKAQQQKQGLISVTLIDKGSDQPITLMQRDPAPTQSFSAIGGWLPDKPTISSGSNPSPTLFPIPKEDSLLSPNRIIGPDDRFRITTTGNWPWSTVVSVLVLRDGQYGLCSGWMVGASAIVTAGHCIFNASAITDKWAKEVIVTPGLDGSQAPFGQCKGFRAIHCSC